MRKKLSKPKIIVILGPTASGKSDLAVKLAKKFNGEIISADSRQVYKGLDIGSGKITKLEMKGAKHHLLDVTSPKRIFTVAQYQKLAKRAINKILKSGKLPIICGGTGLHIDALIYDKKFPTVPPDRGLRRKLERMSTIELFKILKTLDIRRANGIDPHNRRRLIRALEIIYATGKPIPPTVASSPYNVLKIGMKLSLQELKSRIEKRLLKRLRRGMVKEVERLHKEGVSWQRLDDLGLEYRYISRYLGGLIDYKTMKESILKESYKYAKRQMTWFSANGGSDFEGKRDMIHWINNPKLAGKLVIDFLK